MIIENRQRVTIYSIAAALVAIPFIAMQFSKEVKWSGFDFLVAAILLFGTAFIIDQILRKVRSAKSRILLTIGVIVVLVLVWAELAVGVFGTPFAGS